MPITDLSQPGPIADLDAEICIIGSGCGGATAAMVLAEAGHDVIVLEEGGDFTGAKLTQRDGEMYDQLYMDRGGRMTDDLAISVMQGRVLGGGSVINACDVVPIPDGVLEHWQKRFGLTDFSAENLAPYKARALADLSASRIQDNQINRANQIVRDASLALEMDGEAMMNNRVGCEEIGTCLVGCPADAKRNARFVAIPKAVEHGARVLIRSRAVRIEDATKDHKRISVRTLDPRGYHEVETFAVTAKVVILAANAIASSQLLLRSGIGNQHVGRHIMLQPQLPIAAVFEERLHSFRGIPQSWAVTQYEEENHPEHGLWGFRIEPVMGTPGMVATVLPHAGIDAKKQMQLYPQLAAALLLIPDEPSGRVTVTKDGRPVIHYDHKKNHIERAREAVRVAAKVYLHAGAAYAMVPKVPPVHFRSSADLAQAFELEFPPASTPWLSAHQQGGVRFAPSAADGAADPTGQVYGTRDVYVFDSSGYPSSASSHTMTPIMTTSHYLSAQLLAKLG